MPKLLPSQHQPGRRIHEALLDAHEIDPGRRLAALIVLAVPTHFVRARIAALLAKGPHQLAVHREHPNGYGTRAWDGIADRRLGLERVRARRRADRRDALERGRAGGTLLDEVDRAAHRNVIPEGKGVEHDRDRGPRGDVTDQRLDGRALERVIQVIEQIAVDVADHIAL